nr:MAG TPA: hypothetical protein [Caudoviricetes sp.]
MIYKYRNPVYIKENVVDVEVKFGEEYLKCTVNMLNPGDLVDLRNQLKNVHIPKNYKEEQKEDNKIKYKDFIFNIEIENLLIKFMILDLNEIEIKTSDGKLVKLNKEDVKNILKLIYIKDSYKFQIA